MYTAYHQLYDIDFKHLPVHNDNEQIKHVCVYLKTRSFSHSLSE